MEEATVVTQDEFIEFLREECAGSKCQACGSESFTIMGAKQHGLWLFKQKPENAPGYALATHAVYCANCGWIRHHLAFKVEDWVLKRKAENGAPEEKEID